MNYEKPITKNAPEMPPAGIKLSDVYYIIFRRKWLILSFFCAGIIAGTVLWFVQPQLYSSEAKLLVRYVIETRSPEAPAGVQLNNPDSRGESIINSEIEILASMDLYESVAASVGPERILARSGGGSNVTAAAYTIARGVKVDPPKASNVIKIRFSHRDPAICKIVLAELIDAYLKRHKEIHRGASSYEGILTTRQQTLLARIRTNNERLNELRVQAGVVSMEESKKTLSAQMGRLQQEVLDAEAQIAQYEAFLNATGNPSKKEGDPGESGATSEKIAEYKLISSGLDTLRATEFKLQQDQTAEHPQLKHVRARIAETEKQKKALEAENPKLVELYVPRSDGRSDDSEIRLSPARIGALRSKLVVLTNQLAQVLVKVARLDSLEGAINELQLQVDIDQQNYKYITAGLDAGRFNEMLSEAKQTNIQRVQAPSPPSLEISKRLKLAFGALAGGLLGGLAFAFTFEMVFDRTVRRSGDLESKLRMPLMLSIPRLGLNGHAKLLPLLSDSAASTVQDQDTTELRNTWTEDHPLRPFIDGLRDRILVHFEGDPHKPKLIGITSCSAGVGVTSVAAGLAGTLSETGDGNVLLLNLNFDDQAVHPFYRGELTCGLTDALETEKRRTGMVLHNLYVATAGSPADGESSNLSKQLARVVPKLRVSDYDYIVFDLPPATPTTMTARLAGMMDLVLLVVESGKDSQESVKQAGKLLSQSKARVSAVLNKVRNPVPLWLDRIA